MVTLHLGAEHHEGVDIDLPDRPQGREGWFDAEVLVRVDGFAATASVYFETHDFARFLEGLRSLYQTLGGTATLDPRERQLTLAASGNGRGAIDVRGVLFSRPTYGTKLEFEYQIDQTYLPTVIEVLEHFVETYEGGAVPIA